MAVQFLIQTVKQAASPNRQTRIALTVKITEL